MKWQKGSLQAFSLLALVVGCGDGSAGEALPGGGGSSSDGRGGDGGGATTMGGNEGTTATGGKGGTADGGGGMAQAGGGMARADGGAAQTDGGKGNSGGSGGAPPHHVSACPAVEGGADSGNGGVGSGKWEDVTPPGLNLAGSFQTPAGDNFGAHAFVIDPQDTAVVYLGTSAQGIFKTTDCGATWIHVSTGNVDKGRNGSMVIDFADPNVLYTDGRYGPVGLFKSTNGGVDWTQILPPDIANAFIYGGMVEWIAMDPTNHLHLTVSPHFNCQGGHAPNCMLETTDAGGTWNIIDNTPASSELGGQVMLDATTWLSAQPFGGLWRTSNAGGSWTKVFGGASPYIYHAGDGTYYMPGGNAGVIKSSDGIKWTAIPNSFSAGALAATKNALYSSIGLNNSAYFSASLDTTTRWAAIAEVPVTTGNGGWMLGGDPDHNLVYSSNFKGGFWRYSQ